VDKDVRASAMWILVCQRKVFAGEVAQGGSGLDHRDPHVVWASALFHAIAPATRSAPIPGRSRRVALHNDAVTGDNTESVLIIDAANVVGSRPNGWWRDRRGAGERLRDELGTLAERGLDDIPGRFRVVMVVEGQVRGIDSIPTVEIVSAPGSGDDQIVDLVADGSAQFWVVTADRELRRRVQELGAHVLGPTAVRP
jgi:hypothetical protein